jgi:hypothetical protein
MSWFKRLLGKTDLPEENTPSEAMFVENIPPAPALETPQPIVHDISWIFDYIDQDREQKGYDDALINPDGHYRADYVKLFWSSLSLKIKMSKEHYDSLLQEEEVYLDKCEKSGLLDTVAQLNKRMTHVREKIDQLNELAEKAQKQEGEAERAILSYNRGFNRGLAALAQAHVKKHPLVLNTTNSEEL